MLTQNCPRKVILQNENPFYEHPNDVYQRVRGTVHHLLIEKYSEGLEPYIAEVRFKKTVEVDGVLFVITGKPDMIQIEQYLLIDYKSTGDVQNEWKPMRKRLAQEEHIAQINIYRWIVWGGEATEDDPQGNVKKGDIVHLEINEAGVQYMDMKVQKKVGATLWTLEEAEAFVVNALRPHAHYAKTGVLPPIISDVWGNRHLFCNYCAVRDLCDELGREDGDPLADPLPDDA